MEEQEGNRDDDRPLTEDDTDKQDESLGHRDDGMPEKNGDPQRQLCDRTEISVDGTKTEPDGDNVVGPSLHDENVSLRHELGEAKSMLAVAECVKETLWELERQKATVDEELATMQQLLNEAHDEAANSRRDYEHRLAKFKAIVGQLENENHELKIQLKLEPPQNQSQGQNVLDKETLYVITDATKSLARRMKSNLLPSSSAASVSPNPIHTAQSSPSLDDGMRKAYEDTELLKSIVVPLEEQIGALKDKLRETDSLLRQHEDKQSQVVLGVESMAQWLQGQKTIEEAMAVILERSQDHGLAKAKEEAQKDFYLGLMSARYSLLNGELAALRKESKEMMDLLNKERLTVKELKKESVASTNQIVRMQREHLAEVSRLHSVMNEEQKTLIADNKADEVSRTISPTITSTSPSSSSSSSSSSSCSSPSRVETAHRGDKTLAKIVSNVEWEAMQSELAKVRALLGVGTGDSVVGSDQYKALQSELIELKKQKTQLANAVERQKEELKEEAIYRKEVEEKWNERAEQHRTEIEEVARKMKELEIVLQQTKQSYTTLFETTRKDVRSVTADREKLIRELKRLQDETDLLMGKHQVQAQQMQSEPINLPEKTEDMHLMLLKLREELITAKVAREHLEESLRADLTFVRTQLRGEEQAKKSVEDQFVVELDAMREKLSRYQTCRRDLEVEQKRRRDMEMKMQEMEGYMTEKQRLETTVQEMKSRITILQQELDNSVAVQTDFVRLSQSLQMELEKIRQAEKEVRWQHEDDIDNCQNCKLALSVNKRKHHCRHCGRIFCSECVTKTVLSGPRQRPTKVCDVCHTLLVHNSAPYFSSEVPNTN